jgi:hypothetical protein
LSRKFFRRKGCQPDAQTERDKVAETFCDASFDKMLVFAAV